MPDRKLRVFLCHASQDKPIVRELHQRLLAEGWIDPWLDEEKLLPGQDWDMEIEKAVEAADGVIVCLSNNSVSKEGYVQKELRFVLNIADEKPEGTIYIIPVRLNDCTIPRRLRIWQYIDYFPAVQRDQAYQRLLKSLEMRANGLVHKDLSEKNQQKRIENLKGEVDLLKNILTTFSSGLDKISQVQVNQNKVIEDLIQADSVQKHYLDTLNTVAEQSKRIQLLESQLHELSVLKKRVLDDVGIFISYSHADKELVNEISQRFEQDGIKHWLDDKDLLVGEVIDEAISKAIQNNWLFLVVLSPKSIESKWVEREFDEASHEEIEGKKVILPVVAQGLKGKDIPARVRRKLYIDLTEDFEVGYKKLRKSIFSYMADYEKKRSH